MAANFEPRQGLVKSHGTSLALGVHHMRVRDKQEPVGPVAEQCIRPTQPPSALRVPLRRFDSGDRRAALQPVLIPLHSLELACAEDLLESG